MTIGTTDEQQTFADAIRSWCREQNAAAWARELLDTPPMARWSFNCGRASLG